MQNFKSFHGGETQASTSRAGEGGLEKEREGGKGKKEWEGRNWGGKERTTGIANPLFTAQRCTTLNLDIRPSTIYGQQTLYPNKWQFMSTNKILCAWCGGTR